VSKDCQLRITDFGLARFVDEGTLAGNNQLTEYVVTRWYRSPELLLSPDQPYSTAIDIWSIGYVSSSHSLPFSLSHSLSICTCSCIIGELIKRKPLFPGTNHANQVQLILEVRGYQDRSDLGFELSSEALTFLERRCRYPGKSLATYVPNASPEALDLLEHLLDLNPNRRPSATTALEFPYLQDADILCDYSEALMPGPIDEKFFDFERVEYSLEALQAMVREEVAFYANSGGSI
jgi:serine/threonine protein kinase